MTRKELAEFLGYNHTTSLQAAITEAKSIMPSIAGKIDYSRYSETSFTCEEILCICSCIPLNEVQMQLVKENYIRHDKVYINKVSPWIDGTEKFLEKIEKDPKAKACANCFYCCGKSRRGTNSVLKPYCRFYDRFISSIKGTKKHRNWKGIVKEEERPANLFVDSCRTWKRGEVRFFYKKNIFVQKS